MKSKLEFLNAAKHELVVFANVANSGGKLRFCAGLTRAGAPTWTNKRDTLRLSNEFRRMAAAGCFGWRFIHVDGKKHYFEPMLGYNCNTGKRIIVAAPAI